MDKEKILTLRDLVSFTVESLTLVTADLKNELIIIYTPGKEIKLPIAEVQHCAHSCKSFVNYLKAKLNE